MKTMCKTRGGHTSERGKIGKKQWTSDAKNRKKDEIWYYSQVAKVRLKFGQSFPPTHNKQ